MSAKITIKDKNGVKRVDAYDYVYSGTHMGERKVTVEVKSATPIEFAVGDYIELDFPETFTLHTLPVANRVYNSLMISYSLTFWWRGYELKTINFLDYLEGTELDHQYNRNTGEVDVVATIVQLMDRIIANMTRAYNNPLYGVWQYSIHPSVNITKTYLITVANIKCWDALQLVQSIFGLEYRIDYDSRIILIGHPELVANKTFTFGKGTGICEITRLHSEQTMVTRLYAYGSDRNIPLDYRTSQYNHGYMPRLMLPADQYPNGYISNPGLEAEFGIREDYFIDDSIYPTLPDGDNLIDEVMPIFDAPDPNTEVDPVPSKPIFVESTVSWYTNESNERVYVNDTAFYDDVTEIKYSLPISPFLGNGINYNEVTVFIETSLDINAENVKTNLPAKMSFTTGYLQGVELQINSWTKEFVNGVATGRYRVVLQRETNDQNYQIPNSKLPIMAGDKFVLLDIMLPDLHIENAENRLAISASAEIARRASKPLAYSISIPEEYVAENMDIRSYLREGCALPLNDTILGVNATYLVQSVTINYKSEALLPTYELVIADKPLKSRFQELESQLKSAVLSVGATNIRIEQNTINTLKSGNVFKQSITNNYGDVKGAIIESQSINVNSLSVDVRSSRFLLQAYLRVNYLGDINSVYGSDGLLIHKDKDIVWGEIYDDTHQIWTIASPQTFTLDSTKMYWAYIKGSLIDGTATWYLSETKLLVNDVPDYYMFEWGQIMPVVGGERIVQQTYGSTSISHSPVSIATGSEDYLEITEWQELSFKPATGGVYKWNLHSPDQIIGYLQEPSNIVVTVDGVGAIDYSVAAGNIVVTAINANGETLPVNVPAFDILVDTTTALISWDETTGATGYRIYDSATGNYTETTALNIEYLTFNPVTVGVLPVENTAAIYQNQFTIANNDTISIVGEGIDIETEVDELDSTKKVVRIINNSTDSYIIGATYNETTNELTITRNNDLDDIVVSMAGINGADGADGVDAFVYVAYASDNTGTGWSLTPTDLLKYRAEIHSSTALTPVESDFATATWVKYLGDDGSGGGTGGTEAPELHLDFEESGDEFVYNVPYAMKFTSQVSENGDATLDIALNTTMARYDRLTITATASGLVSLYGEYV